MFEVPEPILRLSGANLDGERPERDQRDLPNRLAEVERGTGSAKTVAEQLLASRLRPWAASSSLPGVQVF